MYASNTVQSSKMAVFNMCRIVPGGGKDSLEITIRNTGVNVAYISNNVPDKIVYYNDSKIV